MDYETFTPPCEVGVSAGSSVAFKPRIRQAGFGDGYAQRSGDGLNANPAKLDVVMSPLTEGEANEIMAFFACKKGYLPFIWTAPGERSARQWIATEWQKTYLDAHNREVTAKFEENFDP